ncbi:uncharacterized protein LOC144117738 [Amblyomma americanum]
MTDEYAVQAGVRGEVYGETVAKKKVATLKVEVKRLQRLHQSVGKLSERGKLVFHQNAMKANAKSARAVRYKKEWLCDCLLLKIDSTAAYTFLHEDGFLPLPNPRTLYSYMKNLKADFGFDASLFTLLKETLQEVPEREQRGVLMFDEMSVQKSLHGRESDMKVLGKVNLGEHTRPGDQEKDADHVLVFLFRPFLGGWSKTVGTLCASSASPGSVIAKLLLECIAHLLNSGVVVDAVTCDNSTSNRSALRSLGDDSNGQIPPEARNRTNSMDSDRKVSARQPWLLRKEGVSSLEIRARLVAVYGEQAASLRTVFYRVEGWKAGRKSSAMGPALDGRQL